MEVILYNSKRKFDDLTRLDHPPAFERDQTLWAMLDRVLDTSVRKIKLAGKPVCSLLALLFLARSRAIYLDEAWGIVVAAAPRKDYNSASKCLTRSCKS